MNDVSNIVNDILNMGTGSTKEQPDSVEQPKVKQQVKVDPSIAIMTDSAASTVARVYTNIVKSAGLPIDNADEMQREISEDIFLKQAIRENLPFLQKYGFIMAPMSVALKTASHINISMIKNDSEEPKVSKKEGDTNGDNRGDDVARGDN